MSGTREGIAAVREKLQNASGVTIYDEGLGLGLNSSLMDPVAEHFRRYLRETTFSDLDVPLISNVNGARITQGDHIKEEILHLITRPVAWDKVVDELAQADIILGIGHKSNALDLVREKYPDKQCIALSCEEDLEKVQELVASS